MSGNNPFGANNQAVPHVVHSSPIQAQGQTGTIQNNAQELQHAYLQQRQHLQQRQLELHDLELRQLMDSQQQQSQQLQSQLLAALANNQQAQHDQLLQQQLQQLANPEGDLLSQAIRQEMLAQQQRQAVQEHQIQQQQQALLQTQNQEKHQGVPVDAAHLQLEQRLAQATQQIQIQHGQQPAQYTITSASPGPQPAAQTANGGQSNNSASVSTASDLLKTSPSPTLTNTAPRKSPIAKKTKRKVTEEEGNNPGQAAAHKKRKAESQNGNTTAPEVIVLLDDKEDDPSEIGQPPKRKDIAMLLKATKDPAVKDFDYYRQELAQEAKDKGPELSVLAHEADKKPPSDEEDTPGSYKRIVSVLPQLPSEPDLLGSDGEEEDDRNGIRTETNSPKSLKPKHYILDGPKDKSRDKISELSAALQCGDEEDQYLTGPAFIGQNEEETNPAVIACKVAVDSWWPSNSAVRKERRAQKGTHAGDEEDDEPHPTKNGLFRRSKKTIRAIQSRLDDDIEPGVLQKLPHCKLHRSCSRKKTKTPKGGTVVTHSEPLFCVQVTEAHCTDVMLCCSLCSTWRHAQCGGHYTKTIPKGRPNIPFRPVCDRCYEETKFIKDNPVAQGRIARQRNEHLRRSLATTSVLRHACFSKHSGQYRWPLGQVAPTHIDSHLRSVQTRHDRAVKQWRDAVAKFGANGSKTKNPKDNAKFRMKEFERLLGCTTDAEVSTDLHNMILFLQRDSSRAIPAGFETTTQNFFDPDTSPRDKKEDNDVNDGDDSSSTGREEARACSREGCGKRARFDSMFCSDGCGVSVAEADLLKSMELASTFHPSALSRGIQYT